MVIAQPKTSNKPTFAMESPNMLAI